MNKENAKINHVEGTELSLSLREAVEIAIKNNREISLENYRRDIAKERIKEEEGRTFDPVIRLNLDRGNQEIPVADILYPRGFYSEDFLRSSAGLSGRFITGAKYALELSIERNESTSQTQTLSPRYTSRLNLSIAQPLLKDAGFSVTKASIRLAEKADKVTMFELKDKVLETIMQVEIAYWRLVYALQHMHLQKKSLELAKDLLKVAESKLLAGEVSSIALIEAKAGVAEREAALIEAEGELVRARNDIMILLNLASDIKNIKPIDMPNYNIKNLALDESFSIAFSKNAKLNALLYRVEQSQIAERLADNQRLPKLDIVAEYGFRGISGLPSDVKDSAGRRLGDRIIGTHFEGLTDWRDSFSGYFKESGFRTWIVGMRFEMPIGARELSSVYKQKRLERQSAELQLEIFKDNLSKEIKNTFMDINASLKRLEAERVAVNYAREQLNRERIRLDAGETSFYEFLRKQKDMVEAELRQLKSTIDYNIGFARLRYIEGTSLTNYNIEFAEN